MNYSRDNEYRNYSHTFYYLYKDLLNEVIEAISNQSIHDFFTRKIADYQYIEEQEPSSLPDRKELDNVIFDAIGLTGKERKDLYRVVCRLVWNRVSKKYEGKIDLFLN